MLYVLCYFCLAFAKALGEEVVGEEGEVVVVEEELVEVAEVEEEMEVRIATSFFKFRI